uniref:Uncharacterized protein n=1 Tax=Sphaerodactylus townsendi TaxID=933632 RepID=A0ACB8FUM6_9SAUR
MLTSLTKIIQLFSLQISESENNLRQNLKILKQEIIQADLHLRSELKQDSQNIRLELMSIINEGIQKNILDKVKNNTGSIQIYSPNSYEKRIQNAEVRTEVSKVQGREKIPGTPEIINKRDLRKEFGKIPRK